MWKGIENGKHYRSWLFESEISNEGPVTIVLCDIRRTTLSSFLRRLLDASVLAQVVAGQWDDWY
jgi:hypothetical protein